MTYLLKNNAVFLHIPKAGGSWVSQVLEELDLVQARLGHEHADMDRAFWHDRYFRDGKVLRSLLRRTFGINRGVQRMTPEAFKFCFVREPLGWYESYWRFMESRDWPQRGDEKNPYQWHPDTLLKGTRSSDFNTFIANVNKKRPGFVTEMYGWYVRPGINFVGRQENLVEDLIKAFDLMNLDIDPERVRAVAPCNETPSHILRPEWDPKLKAQTLRLEYTGYVRFDYGIDEALVPFETGLADLAAA